MMNQIKLPSRSHFIYREIKIQTFFLVAIALIAVQILVINFYYNKFSSFVHVKLTLIRKTLKRQFLRNFFAEPSKLSVQEQNKLLSLYKYRFKKDRYNGTLTFGDLCRVVPPFLVGAIDVDKSVYPIKDIEDKYKDIVNKGGHWKPKNCVSRDRVAIIIPYRDRSDHLAIFLNHMHSFLMKQQLHYGIYVVELIKGVKFNRAMLMNIGFIEALKIYSYDCFIFHDVDLYPEDDRNLYSCPESPRHMSVAIDKFGYLLPYREIFGGVCALRKQHMVKVNGFSNMFFGWGGEDDDMYNRLSLNNLEIIRYPNIIASYTMMSHTTEIPNPIRRSLIDFGKFWWQYDGINSLKYNRLSLDFLPLYTRIFVNISMRDVLKAYPQKPLFQGNEMPAMPTD